MNSGALIQGDYRYLLWRIWDEKKPVMVWIMLNPSTADASEDDPTIRRCMGFARRNGNGGIRVVNLYAYRAMNPNKLRSVQDPIGRTMNDTFIWSFCRENKCVVVCAWGAFRVDDHRAKYVMNMLKMKSIPLYRLGASTKAGHPRHPLYLKSDSPLVVHP